MTPYSGDPDMTTEEMRQRMSEIAAEQDRLTDEKYHLRLALEEAEGRADSHEARFARAYLAGDVDSMDRLCAEGDAEFYRKHGKWPQQSIRDESARIVANEIPGHAAEGGASAG